VKLTNNEKEYCYFILLFFTCRVIFFKHADVMCTVSTCNVYYTYIQGCHRPGKPRKVREIEIGLIGLVKTEKNQGKM